MEQLASLGTQERGVRPADVPNEGRTQDHLALGRMKLLGMLATLFWWHGGDIFGWSGLKRLSAIGRSLLGKEAEKLGRNRRKIAAVSLSRSHERERQRTGSRKASENPVLQEGTAGHEAQEKWTMKGGECRARKMSRPLSECFSVLSEMRSKLSS